MVRKRCGCGGECTCSFTSGTGVEVTEGMLGFTIRQREGNTEVSVEDTPSVDLTLAGVGTTASPYVISGDKAVGQPDPPVAMSRELFEADGTWTKPLGFETGWAEIICFGAGGGGGGASTGSTVNDRIPGGGGGGGGATRRVVWIADLPDEVPVTIGSGGASGPGSPDSSGLGGFGGTGGSSTFGIFAYAGGGRGGSPNYPGLGGAGTEQGGQGILHEWKHSPAVGTMPLAATGSAGAGGGAGGWHDGSTMANADPDFRNGAPGGNVVGGGLQPVGGQGGDYLDQTPPTPGGVKPFTNDDPTLVWPTSGTGGGGGAGRGEPDRPRMSGAAGGSGGGGGGGGAGASTGGNGGRGGDGRVIVTCWQGAITVVPETLEPPTSVVATPAATSITLTWSAPASGPTPTSYQVRFSNPSTGAGIGSPTDVGLVFTHTFLSLFSDSDYGVDVRSVRDGRFSTWVQTVVHTLT